MMKIMIIAVGKTDGGFIEDGCREYMSRLRGCVDIEMRCVKSASNQDIERLRLKESSSLLNALPSDYYRIVLDETGSEMSSESFAHRIERIRDFEGGRVVFVIGGAFGLADEFKINADAVMSMSAMTFTHQMVRLFLLEQLYRAFQILQGTDYHK